MPLFYSKEFTLENPFLSEEEAKHCIRVLRLKSGNEIHITNGFGEEFIGELDILGKKARLEHIEAIQHKKNRTYSFHLAIAPTKNMDRIEWLVEKATEIGLDEISFIKCQNSERNKLRIDRIEKRIVSALKQSKQFFMPKINSFQSFNEFLSRDFHQAEKYIAHCETSSKKVRITHLPKDKAYLILIGPEGDFSPEEIKQAIEKGFSELDLSANRLRTETAGLVACQTLNTLHYV